MSKARVQTCRMFGILVMAFCVTSCASDKPKTAPAPAAAAPATPPPQPVSLGQIKSEILAAKAQIDTTTNALVTLQGSSTTDAQGNYNRFAEEFVKLQHKSDAVHARA